MVEYNTEEIRVIIPVGGEARRLKPLTAETSKACVRFLNRSLIEISIGSLADQGIRNFIFGVKGFLNYKTLFDYFKEGVGFSARYNITPRVHIKYSPNVDDLGNADSMRIIMDYYQIRSPLLVIQGDNIVEVDLHKLLQFHQHKKAFVTIGLTSVENVEEYGVAEIDENMRISRFVEKPKLEEAPSNLISTGLYLFAPEVREIFNEPEIQKKIQQGRRLDFGYDLLPYIVESGRPVYGFVLKGKWFDVGNPSNYLTAIRSAIHGQLKFLKDFGGRISDKENIWIQGSSAESIRKREEIVKKLKEGRIELAGGVLIGRHCLLDIGVRIFDSCIDNYTVIGANSGIINSAVMDRSRLGENVEIQESIIGRHAEIEKSSKVISSVIGDDVSIGENCYLMSTKVYPHIKIPSNKKIVNKILMSQSDII